MLRMPFVEEVVKCISDFLYSYSSERISVNTDGVMFEGQRLRVEMSKGSAEAYGVSSSRCGEL